MQLKIVLIGLVLSPFIFGFLYFSGYLKVLFAFLILLFLLIVDKKSYDDLKEELVVVFTGIYFAQIPYLYMVLNPSIIEFIFIQLAMLALILFLVLLKYYWLKSL